ncbi:MAG: EamA/RhaT family transporter [Ignavibacteriae bacterium]|nr:MAG: EamA/RhaT family transporter [Ignavibacteriota bacterium]
MNGFQPISRTRAESYLLSLTLIWGSTFVLTKFILEDASPFVYVAIRFFTASILFAALFFRRLRTISREGMRSGLVLGVLLFAGFVLQTVGLKFTTASKSAFVTGLMVVFTPIFQLTIERKAPKIGNMIGVVLVAVGLYLLTSPEGSEFNIGDALTLICAVLFSIYTVYLGIYGRHHDPAHLTFIQFASTALLAAISIPLFETARINLTSHFLMNLAYLAVMPTVVALYVMAKYQKYTTPTRSAIIYSMEPPFAAMFAFFIIGEQIGLLGIIGGIVILSGLIISELSDVLFSLRKNEIR